MTPSRWDHLYRYILMTRFFTKGWGKPESLKRLFEFRKIMSNRQLCFQLVEDNHDIRITKEVVNSDFIELEGQFQTPLSQYLPGLVPPESKTAYFQMLVPKRWNEENFKPICLHFAGTGDHGYWRRRRFMARPLLKAGIASILLENPFYGLRKPKEQTRSSLQNVSDIFVMGGCLMLESIAIFKWCEKQGFGPLGLTGLSMGGHMASLAATTWPKPVVLVPCLSWSTASQVFTEGVMADGINWQLLEKQYFSDVVFRNEIKKMVHIDEEAAFIAGRSFAKNYPASLDRMITSLGGGDLLPNFTDQEVQLFMRGIMDECTHLGNFEIPVDTELIIAICAQRDAYVPRDGCVDLAEVWPGAEVRFVDAGHVTAFILHHGLFRKAIIEAFERWKKKYQNNIIQQTSTTNQSSVSTTDHNLLTMNK